MSDKSRILEIFLVILTGIGKFVFMDWLNLKLGYISLAIVFWLAYVMNKYRRDKRILEYWGLTKTNFKYSLLELLPYAAACVSLFVIIGIKLDTNILDWTIIPILIVYPIWGIIQQFLIIGLIAKNLTDLRLVNMPMLAVVFLTAFVFSMVHYPSALLMMGTFLLALVYTTLYLKQRNLIVLGIYHGWIGAFFYYTILKRDPWQEVFSILTN